MPGRLDSKVAIVTGAGCVEPGWGNGRAAVAAFVREGAQMFGIDLRAMQWRKRWPARRRCAILAGK
jgi:NAD(P)-dependent dehydrogenase (short-subunit alcohol dehydrogenase family)